MKIWTDAQLSPHIASWLRIHYSVDAVPVRDLGLRDATDEEIFEAARKENAVVLTKDRDFLRLLSEHGSPPQVLWLTCGNTSNARLKKILSATLPTALDLLLAGDYLVEINDAKDNE